MANEEPMGLANPAHSLVLDDIRNCADWRNVDAQILRRRLGERRKRRTRPYKNAPNGRVLIVDDLVREKTNQEATMVNNAPLYASAVPLAQMEQNLRRQIEVAFDTYLRYMIAAPLKMEEALDCKNARGFAVVKQIRSKTERWGELPDFEARDPRFVLVPTGTREIANAERITDVLELTERELRARAKDAGWNEKIVNEIITKLTDKSDDSPGSQADLTSAHSETAHLVGLTTSGPGTGKIVIWEHWHYASQWDAGQDATSGVIENRRCCSIFCPDLPDKLLALFPWREADQVTRLQGPDAERELALAEAEGRQPELEISIIPDRDRPWPFIQPRFESRSRYFYDTRGVGHLCMDDQIFASGQLNAKMVMVEYYMTPLFTGPGNPNNLTFEPGSFLPEGVAPVSMPQVPQQFDYDIERHRRTAARRVGAMSQYEFSGEMSSKKGVQKTAREIEEESVRGNTITSSDVCRFNWPWQELFQQLWEDLGRMRKPLPMIFQGEFQGNAGPEIYGQPILWVPTGNAKTMNPDVQFVRAREAWGLVAATLQLGVTADPQAAVEDIIGNWDPFRAQRWLRNPNKAGPQGQLPVYAALNQLAQTSKNHDEMLKQIQDVCQKLAVLAEENARRLDALAKPARALPGRTAA